MTKFNEPKNLFPVNIENQEQEVNLACKRCGSVDSGKLMVFADGALICIPCVERWERAYDEIMAAAYYLLYSINKADIRDYYPAIDGAYLSFHEVLARTKATP